MEFPEEFVSRLTEHIKARLPDAEIGLVEAENGSLAVVVNGMKVLDFSKSEQMLSQISDLSSIPVPSVKGSFPASQHIGDALRAGSS